MRLAILLTFSIFLSAEDLPSVPINKDFKMGMFTLNIHAPVKECVQVDKKTGYILDSAVSCLSGVKPEIAIVCSEECHRQKIDMIEIEVCHKAGNPQVNVCSIHHAPTLIGDNLIPAAIADPPLDFDPQTIKSIRVFGYSSVAEERKDFKR